MFGLFDLFMKRVSEQAADYAAAQSDVARRNWSEWTDPFLALQPAKVAVDRHARSPRRGSNDRRSPF